MMYLLMQLMEEIVMNKFINLTKRNIKVYFSDKSMFFVSLITPLILLVLYYQKILFYLLIIKQIL